MRSMILILLAAVVSVHIRRKHSQKVDMRPAVRVSESALHLSHFLTDRFEQADGPAGRTPAKRKK